MSKEKQIEEMREELIVIQQKFNEYCAKPCRECDLGGIICCEKHYQAEHLYNAGYRKQEWISVEGTMKCSRCRRRMPKIDGARYCPICGAKMKATEVSTTPAKKDYYTPEEVRSMSQREVRKNIEIIRRSMKMWG